MIRINDIKEGLQHLVGWEQGILPEDQIDGSLTESESGLTFQAAHPMVTLRNLKSVMPEMAVKDFPEWNKYKFYHKGEVVQHNGFLFQAQVNNIAQEPRKADFNDDFNNDFSRTEGSPVGSAGYWKTYDPVSVWLKHQSKMQS